MKVTFLGLGAMGYPMAGHQQQAGLEVCVYNRTTAKAQQWVEQYGGRYSETPAQAVADADIIITCLGNDDDVRAVVCTDDGVLANSKAGAIFIDHTTTSEALALELAALASKRGISFLDAPVSGGQLGAENGALTVMVGGDADVLGKAAAALEPYAKNITHMGDVGAGQLTNMVNQLLIAGILQGLSEGLALAQKADLDLPKVIEAVSQGAAQSWQLENRGINMMNDKFDYGFAIDWMRKDLGFCFETAERLGIDIPNAKQVDERYGQLQARGFGRCDTSVLIKQYDE